MGTKYHAIATKFSIATSFVERSENAFGIGRVILQDGEPAVSDEEHAIADFSFVPDKILPLTFVLNKFNVTEILREDGSGND